MAIAAGEIVAFDLLLSNFNRAFSGSHDYDVSWHSIRHNLRGPWVVDDDPFSVNQFAHPYQGSLYHAAGRSMGLNYWEASAMTFAGSAWWEITGEKTPPSKNDQVASGIAGSFLGEPLFRMAHLVGDHSSLPAAWRPWLASAISPPVGFNRLAFGDRYGGVVRRPRPGLLQPRCTSGGNHVTNDNFASSNGVKTKAAQVDYAMDYGLPGKPGYSYRRPFDYFNFEAALSSSNGVENLTSNGMLLGDHFALGRQRARHRRRLRRLRVPGAADLPGVDDVGVAGHHAAMVGGRAPGDPGRGVGRRRLRGGQLDAARRREHRIPLRHGAARRDEPAADRGRPAVAGRRRRASCRSARSPTAGRAATMRRAWRRRSPGA